MAKKEIPIEAQDIRVALDRLLKPYIGQPMTKEVIEDIQAKVKIYMLAISSVPDPDKEYSREIVKILKTM